MKNVTALLSVFVLFQTASAAIAAPQTATVVSVHDGDTLTVKTADEAAIKIRLWGIDAPEGTQAYGGYAKSALERMAPVGKAVTVDILGKDIYGRNMSILYVGGKNINEALVREGYAWWHFVSAPKAANLAQAYRAAKAARAGVWRNSDPLPPWIFRQQKDIEAAIRGWEAWKKAEAAVK